MRRFSGSNYVSVKVTPILLDDKKVKIGLIA